MERNAAAAMTIEGLLAMSPAYAAMLVADMDAEERSLLAGGLKALRAARDLTDDEARAASAAEAAGLS